MNIWKKFLGFLDQKVEGFGAQYKTFGIFGAINYPLSYCILYYLGTNESAIIRLIAFLMCLPLIFTKYWPSRTKKYINLYWFLTLLYCLPTLGIYLLLQNHMSTEWLMNISLGLFLLFLLVDWAVFIVIYLLGILLGYLLFLASAQELVFQQGIPMAFIYAYLATIIIGIVFARSNERTHQTKLHTMKMLAGSIAHELRTPLSAIRMDADFLFRFFPYYQDAYTKAKEAQLPIHKLAPNEENGMITVPQNLQTLSRNAHTMITMMLTNLNEGTANQKTEVCSMKACVAEALKTYPFSARERTLLHWEEDGADFSFLGHKEFTKHVLFNLLKNALHAIAAAGKGEIFMTIEPANEAGGKEKNRLVFKDTGPGIPPKNLRHIFDRFYTNTAQGTGIGLAFCQSVIQGFGGEITCASKEGEHTTFTISLPGTK